MEWVANFCKGCQICINECPDRGAHRGARTRLPGWSGSFGETFLKEDQYYGERTNDDRLPRSRRGCKGGRSGSDLLLPYPPLYGDHDGACENGRQWRIECGIRPRRRRACPGVGGVGRLRLGRPRLHGKFRRRRHLCDGGVQPDGRRPVPRADVDRRPDARSSRRFRFRAHGCHVDPRSGLASGMGLLSAGGVRQYPDLLPCRRRPPRDAAPDGVPGRVFHLPYPGQGHPGRSVPGEGVPASLPADRPPEH